MKEPWKCEDCGLEWIVKTQYAEPMRSVEIPCPYCKSVETARQKEKKMYVLWIHCKNCGNLYAERIPFGVSIRETTGGLQRSYRDMQCSHCGSPNVHKWKVGWPKPRKGFLGLANLIDGIDWGDWGQYPTQGEFRSYLDLLSPETRDRILRSIQFALEIDPLLRCAENLENLAKGIRKDAVAMRKEILEDEPQ